MREGREERIEGKEKKGMREEVEKGIEGGK